MNAVITGASRGIGKAIAESYAEKGYDLFLNSRSELALYKAVEDIYSKFPSIHIKATPADLSSRQGCRKFIDAILAETNQIDVLVNNAGSYVPGSVYNEPDGNLEEMINTNLYSAYHVTRGLVGKMIENKKGHIFNMCSIASIGAYHNGGSYSISKYAMLGFGKNLREEMKPHGVKVTNLMPGAVYTDSWAASGIDPDIMMTTADIATFVVTMSQLSTGACVEDIVIRLQQGDL